MSLRADVLKVAALKTLLETVTAEYEQSRAQVLAGLKTAADEVGLASARVLLPDGTPVGAVSLTQPRARLVVEDEKKFTAWAQDNYPSEVETITRVRARWQKAFLARLLADLDGGWTPADPSTGEVVPGVVVVEPGAPSHFSMRLPGIEALAAAMRDGLARDLLTEITGGPAAIEGE